MTLTVKNEKAETNFDQFMCDIKDLGFQTHLDQVGSRNEPFIFSCLSYCACVYLFGRRVLFISISGS